MHAPSLFPYPQHRPSEDRSRDNDPPYSKENIRGIHGIGRGAIAFTLNGFRGIYGISHVAVAFRFNSIHRERPGLQYRV